MVLGNWAFVSDLRTGAFSGGGGEQALLGAASGQMSAFYGLPGGMGAGMSDSKLPDNQAGFEKGLTMGLAALSGGGFVYESAGMLASLLGCSFEAMVIDDDMLSSIRRIARGIEVSDETPVGGGHRGGGERSRPFPRHAADPGADGKRVRLSAPRGPVLARRLDRDAGAKDIRDRAAVKAKEILATHRPTLIEPETDARIRRERFAIHLDPVRSEGTAP